MRKNGDFRRYGAIYIEPDLGIKHAFAPWYVSGQAPAAVEFGWVVFSYFQLLWKNSPRNPPNPRPDRIEKLAYRRSGSSLIFIVVCDL